MVHYKNWIIMATVVFTLIAFILPPADHVVAQSCVQPPSGLVSWWPLDETDGATTADIIGGNDGTLVNGPIQVVGKVADALSFDGIDDYVDLGSNSSLDIPGSVTIDAWVRFMGFVGSQWYSYFVADFGTGGWISQLSLGIWGSGENFQFYAYEGRSSSDNTYVYSSAKTKGQWYHVAVVRDDAAKTIKLYVNGNIEASESYAGKEPVSLQGHKYLGSSGPSFGDYFNGNLDEVEIYNRALSDSEIQAIFEAGSAGKCNFTIDIKPGSYPNSINPKSKGNIPVAILSTGEFDAPSQVVQDQESLTFGPTGKEKSLAFCDPQGEDVNGDGLPDLVCHFYTQLAGFGCGDAQGILIGLTVDGKLIEGKDSVKIIPCR